MKTRATGAAVLVNDGGGWEREHRSPGRFGLENSTRGKRRGSSEAPRSLTLVNYR